MNVEASCLPHPSEPGTYLLFVELSAAEEVAKARKPVHLAVAIDASSSMGGPRLACAVDAARSLVERLTPDDTLCLMSFDREPRVLFGPGRIDDAARRAIETSLAALKPGIGTALHAAVTRSYEALRRVFVRDARPHAIILTDGFPSVGPVEREIFFALSQKAQAEGIATSAVGIGLDYDEKCVAALAEGGGGRYSFVDKAADIPGALARHLSDLFAIAVENVTVRVSPAAAVREAVLLHRYAMRVTSEGFAVETGPIGRGAPRRLLFTLKAPAAPEPVAATLAVAPRGAPGEPDRIFPVPVNAGAPSAREAVRELYRLSLAATEEKFWDSIHRRDKAASASLLNEMDGLLKKLADAGTSEAELEHDRLRIADERAVHEGRLSGELREAARKRSHQTSVSRITGFEDLE